MSIKRSVTALGIAVAGVVAGLAVATPASAQFFFRSHDFSDQGVKGDEANLGQVLPGATEAELRAAMAWNMRAALNVAALQCQFEPTLLSVANYNAVLTDHNAELKAAFATLGKYFARVAKTPKAGQTALDQFGTRTYSNFVTVGAQYGFCQTASSIGHDMVFAPRGGFSTIAMRRIRELRNSLIPYGEQQFQRYLTRDVATIPRLDPICYDKKGLWVEKKCGAANWPPAGTGLASR